MANPNWKKGVSGNPAGRPVVPEIELFRLALQQVEKEKNLSLLVHAVRRAYVEDSVLGVLIKKILPEKIELKGAHIVVEFDDDKKQEDKKNGD